MSKTNVIEPVLPFELGDLKVSLEERDALGGGKELVLAVTAPSLLVDRPEVYTWCFALEQRKLAERMLKCVQAGKAFSGYQIHKDIYGKTYLSAKSTGFFHRRHMTSELRKLGF